MRVKFKREKDTCWYSEYHIYIDDTYLGWIAKYRKKNKVWEAYSSKLRIGPMIGNDTFNTLKSAKDYVEYRIYFYEDEGYKL